jgi:predicted TPR repeat methyltransferase
VCDTENPLEAAEKLIAAGRAGEAARLLAARLAEGRGGILMRLMLARAYLAAGDLDAALREARETAQLYPDLAGAALGLGEALLAAEKLPTAIAELQRALRLDPDLNDARAALGRAWLRAGEAGRAQEYFAQLPADWPGLPALQQAAAAILTAPRSDAGYVRHLFDQFSADYDARMLEQLHYRAPNILRALFDMIAPGERQLRILDFGCGTGLSGAAFRDLADHLAGLDLSPNMIAQARARAIYDGLGVGDIEQAQATGFDLVVAADTLVYLGDLAGVFAAAARALKSGGCFLFTVERSDGEGFVLGPKRRWQHGAAYLRAAAAAAGFDVCGLVDCEPRCEKGVPVPGYAAALQKMEDA